MTLHDLNATGHDGFVGALGAIFEDSAWVAERAWRHRPFASLEALHQAMMSEVSASSRDEQLALLRAHPDLGARARMTTASAGEQAAAGLDRLAPSEFDRLQALNAAYREKFGFPFLLAVKGNTKHDVLAALAARLSATIDEEFAEALRQVSLIAWFRLQDVVVTQGRPRVERFASGWKRHFYGKGDVIVYRLNRDGQAPSGQCPVFGANVLMLIYGDAFWPTYTTGDNTGLIATDSMKNFIQRETMDFAGFDLEGYCRFLADKFLATYPQVEGVQVSAEQIPYQSLGGPAFTPSGPERATARVEIKRGAVVEARSGLRGFRLLRLGGSAFRGFVRDQYTTLPDLMNRPLHMWLDLEWHYTDAAAAFNEGRMVARVRELVRDVFAGFESGSIQQLIHRIGTKLLDENPTIAAVDLEANNRTWDTIAERGHELGVYTDARPPYGCLGLSLKR